MWVSISLERQSVSRTYIEFNLPPSLVVVLLIYEHRDFKNFVPTPDLDNT